MTLLIAGLVLWTVAHFFKRVTPGARASMGNAGKGVMAVLILASVVMMVIGYRAAPVDVVFEAPSWGKPVNNILMLVAVALLGMGSSKGRARAWLRHPMLIGVLVWAGAHILVNGDVASLVLFGGIAAWAVVSMVLINRGEGPWQRPEPGPASGDVRWLVISAVVFAVIAGIHIWIGPSPFGA
ncbi:MAG: NnrU family protein [Paracoccaceae bacterium]